MTREFKLIDGDRKCLLIPQNFRIWQAEAKKLFVIAPKNRLLAETMTALQRSDAKLMSINKEDAPLPHCERSNVIIYP